VCSTTAKKKIPPRLREVKEKGGNGEWVIRHPLVDNASAEKKTPQ